MLADKKESNSDSFVSGDWNFEAMSRAVCPKCDNPEKVRKILWGMSDSGFIGALL